MPIAQVSLNISPGKRKASRFETADSVSSKTHKSLCCAGEREVKCSISSQPTQQAHLYAGNGATPEQLSGV